MTCPILHLEDDPLDAELVDETLRQQGMDPRIERVDTWDSFVRALEEGTHEAILADYALPGIDPEEALQYARKVRPDTPLIFLSGTLGEEKTVDLLHRGASDCVLKQNLGRLVPALRRAMEEAQEKVRRRQAEEALREAKEAAEEGNRAKDRFMLTVSHELRTPLTVLMGMLELAQTEEMSPRARQYLGTASESSETLLSLITDILDFSGIEKGQITLAEEPFSPRECLRSLSEAFRPEAEKKNLSWDVDFGAEVPEILVGDCRRFQQVVRNVLDNAVRFTEKGGIRASLTAKAREEGACDLSIQVWDTGIGIPEEKLEQIFDRFSQADMSLTRGHSGAGLGLAISRGLLERMGGNIAVQSRRGEGSTFSISVPFRTRQSKAPSTDQDAAVEEALPRILVAEDEVHIGELIRMILERQGWKADVAPNGEAALQKWQTGAYDLVLMDLQMPRMNGLEAARAIREREENGRRIPIIAVTAHIRTEERRACQEAGMDDFIQKPMQAKEVKEKVSRWLDQGRAPEASAALTPAR